MPIPDKISSRSANTNEPFKKKKRVLTSKRHESPIARQWARDRSLDEKIKIGGSFVFVFFWAASRSNWFTIVFRNKFLE